MWVLEAKGTYKYREAGGEWCTTDRPHCSSGPVMQVPDYAAVPALTAMLSAADTHVLMEKSHVAATAPAYPIRPSPGASPWVALP